MAPKLDSGRIPIDNFTRAVMRKEPYIHDPSDSHLSSRAFRNLWLYAIRSAESPGDAGSVTGAQTAEPDLVVAKVAGLPLTENQVLTVIDQLATQQRLSLDQLKQRNAILFKDAINQLVRLALVKNQIRLQA